MGDIGRTADRSESDLAFLKRMAMAGRGRPVPVLPLMVVFGAAYGASFLLIYVDVLTGGRLPGWTHYVLVAAHLIFGAGLVWTGWRAVMARRRGLNRAAAAAWTAAFVALIVTVLSFRIYASGEPPTDQIYTSYMLPPVLLVLWGMAWWTSAIVTDRRGLVVVAIASFAAALAAAVVGNSVHLLLLAGLCLIGLIALPALYLMRQDRGA